MRPYVMSNNRTVIICLVFLIISVAALYIFTTADNDGLTVQINKLVGNTFKSTIFKESEGKADLIVAKFDDLKAAKPDNVIDAKADDFITDKACIKRLEARKVPNGLSPPQQLSYRYLHSRIYSKYGFLPVPGCRTKPWLALVHRDQAKSDFCLAVFGNWTKANDKIAPDPPPETIPDEMLNDYLLDNNVGRKNKYRNDHSGLKTYDWSKDVIQQYVEKAKLKVNMAYGNECQNVYRAVESIPMRGLGYAAAVIGSIRPWIEEILLVNGVSSIVTMEYGEIITDHPQLSYAHPTTNSQSYLKAYNYAGNEKSGLGRYGDVMDPWGDVREMQKIWCMLKPGGIAMIGIYVTIDKVVFNLHRIYGPIRLPLMTAGFEVVSMFMNNRSIDLTQLKEDRWPYQDEFGLSQPMIVLKKIII